MADDGMDGACGSSAPSERRRFLAQLLAGSALAASAVLLAEPDSEASTAVPTEVELLQTAASVENLLISAYRQAGRLSLIAGSSAPPLLNLMMTTYFKQHQEHLASCNTALRRMGAKSQPDPNPALAPTFDQEVGQLLATPAPELLAAWSSIALRLENISAATYVHYASLLSPGSTRSLLTSIAGVEAQHFGVYLMLQALVTGGSTNLAMLTSQAPIVLPTGVATVGFPNSLYLVSSAATPERQALR